MSNKKWIEERKGKHVLSFTPYYEEERLAIIYKDDGGWYCNSKLLNLQEEYLGNNTLEDVKEEIENAIENHYEDERNYYQEVLDKFKEK